MIGKLRKLNRRLKLLEKLHFSFPLIDMNWEEIPKESLTFQHDGDVPQRLYRCLPKIADSRCKSLE
jgi:hypothetical protein